jgi:HK97 family phage major capsid protein
MRNIELMKQDKGVKVKAARDITNLAETEKRSLTPEEKGKIDGLLADIREMDADILREEQLQAQEMAKAPASRQSGDFKKERRAAFFKSLRHGRAMLNAEERAIVEDSTGALMVPEDLEQEIYLATPAYSVIRNLANIRQTTRDKIARRSLTDVTMGWGKLETGSLPTEGVITPSKDYIYVEDLSGLMKIGRDELMDTDQALEAAIVQAFAQKRAYYEDWAFIKGRGHSYSEPDGVTLDTTVIANYIDLDTADTMVPDDLLEIEYDLPTAFKAGASFMLHPTTEGVVRKVKATSNYLWVNPTGVQGPSPRTFDGYPMYNSDNLIVPASDNTDRSIVGLFGNWRAGYTIVDRQGMTVQRLDELYAESGMVGFLFYCRVGGGVVRPDAFRALDNNT